MKWVRVCSFILCVFSCFTSYTQSTIVESSTIHKVNHYISQDTQKRILVILDLDETIITNTTGLGTDSWFYTLLNKLHAYGLAPEHARSLMRSLYINVQKHTKLRLIEEHAPTLIVQWQTHNLHVIALTARSMRLAEHTAQQLDLFNIHFTDLSPAGRDHSFSFPALACHHKGIVCCGPHNKGTVLTHWLNALEFKPDLIIFVDDKIHNIHDVQRAVELRNIDFVGIRYARCDEEIKNFNFEPTIAELQKLYDTHPEIERLPVAITA
jgi:hypothetical protein